MGQKVSGILGDKVLGITEEILLYHEDGGRFSRSTRKVSFRFQGTLRMFYTTLFGSPEEGNGVK